jgi:uncharacterized protein (DUF427 family)
MARAMWNGEVIAESDTYEKVEGNVYFPPEAIKREYFQPSERTSVCGWKGTARYYDVVVAGETNPAAAWYYPQPKNAAAGIKDHVAFWNGVVVEA